MIIHNLKQLGLNEKEAKVYLAALEFGPTTIAKIAYKSGIKRTTIYEFLDNMITKGIIVSSISGKRTFYSGVDPKELEKLIEKQKEIIKNLVPELSLLIQKSPKRPKIRFYEGVEGLKYVLYDTLNQNNISEILSIASLEKTFDILPKSFINKYIIDRKAKKIKMRAIIPYDENAEEMKEKNKQELREMIIVPKNKLPISVRINIYQNKIAILSFGEEKVSLIIESQQIANTMRAIFNLLWENLKKKKK